MNTDKNLVRERFEASFDCYDRDAHVQQRICMRLASRVEETSRGGVSRGLEIGAGTGFLTARLVDMFPEAKWFLNDLAPGCERFLAKYVAGHQHQYLWGDAETLEFPGKLDLIASASTVQWFADLPGFAHRAAAALNTGGRVAISLFGTDHFRQIKATTGQGLDFRTLPELSHIFEVAGFRILLAEDYTETLTFPSPREVLEHIRSLGMNAVRKGGWAPGRLKAFEEDYRRLFSLPGRGVTLTYHPVLLIAEKL